MIKDITHRREAGFTLIELLVVMIIIGILAAVAIPIFMNQQKTSRDTALVSDVKNVATNLQSMMVQYPDASVFAATNGVNPPTQAEIEAHVSTGSKPIVSANNGTIWLAVGNSPSDFTSTKVSLSQGSRITVSHSSTVPGQKGAFLVLGHHPDGKQYVWGNRLHYDSYNGGLQN